MSMLYQKTIRDGFEVKGVGLHSGQDVRMVVSPAPPDTGIVFVVDGSVVKASHDAVTDTSYATSLERGGAGVRTVEHLLAAFAGLMIDNAYVELDGGEVPILDGSAWPFVKLLKEAGQAVQTAPRRYLKILKPVTVHDGDKSATLLPSPVQRITYRIDFRHPLLSDQSLSLELDPIRFEGELAAARTFGFLRDVEMLRKAGLARGGSLDNAVVLDDERILNPEGLRFDDEFVRHKMMDAVGDLALLGMPFIGHLVADKSGHRLNHRLVREIMARKDCWIIVEGETETDDATLSLSMTEAAG